MIPRSRRDAAYAYDSARNTIVMFGGFGFNSDFGIPGSFDGLSDTWEFDVASKTWTQITPITSPAGRFATWAGYDPVRNKVVMHGGQASSAANTQFDETWEYTPGASATWTQITPTVSATPAANRYVSGGGGLQWDPVRHVLTRFGGVHYPPSGVGGTNLNEVWEYNGTTWTQRASGSFGAEAMFVYDPSRSKFVTYGGADAAGSGSVVSPATFEFDSAANTWTNRGVTTPGAAAAMSAFALGGKVIFLCAASGALGGTITIQSPTQQWEWDGTAGTWTKNTTATLPTPRDQAMVAVASNGHAFLTGGADPSNVDLHETWEYDGTNWVQVDFSPTPPTGLNGFVNGLNSIGITWTAPSYDGNSAITGYTVTVSPGGSTISVPSPGATFTGGTLGTTYTFTVHATNAIGNSAESAPASVLDATAPSVPTSVVAVAGNASAAVSWQPPASDGGSPITGYRITATYSDFGGGFFSDADVTVPATQFAVTLTGLQNDRGDSFTSPQQGYNITVYAINALGSNPAAPINVIPTAAPPPPPPPSHLGPLDSSPPPSPSPSSLTGGAANDDAVAVLRKHLSSALDGLNWDALLAALAKGDEGVRTFATTVFDQLFKTSANGIYLDRLLGDEGIERQASIGMSDDLYRQLGIKLSTRRVVVEALWEILEVYYGIDAVRAHVSSVVEPFAISNGDTLTVQLDGQTTVTATFSSADFRVQGAATAQEVAAATTRAFRQAGVKATAVAVNDPTLGSNVVRIYSGALGFRGAVRCLGGTAQNVLLFPTTKSADPLAKIVQASSTRLDIVLPATTQAVNRSKGSGAYLHTPLALMISSLTRDALGIVTVQTSDVHGLAAGNRVFIDGAYPTPDTGGGGGQNGSFVVASIPSSTSFTFTTPQYPLVTSIAGGTVMPAKAPVQDTIPGPYMYDPASGVAVTGKSSPLGRAISRGQRPSTLAVADATQFPDSEGWLVLGFGTSKQQGPVHYVGRIDGTTLQLDQNRAFTVDLPVGTDVTWLAQKGPWVPESPETVGSLYLTASPAGRIGASETLDEAVAAGIRVCKTIVYPGDYGMGAEGLGTAAPKRSDKVWVWSGDDGAPPPDTCELDTSLYSAAAPFLPAIVVRSRR